MKKFPERKVRAGEKNCIRLSFAATGCISTRIRGIVKKLAKTTRAIEKIFKNTIVSTKICDSFGNLWKLTNRCQMIGND